MLANKLQEMIIQKEIARCDFNRVCELNNYETFTKEQVEGYAGHIKSLIHKSETSNLSGDEIEAINTFNEDLPELHKAIVLNDDLTRELVYYRERKVIFDDVIEKSEGNDIEKARSGVYANTAQNRKLGRVGQKYAPRDKKAEGEEKNFDTAKEMKDAFGSLSPEQIQKKLKHYEGQVEKVKERYSGDHPKDKEYVEFAEKQLKAFKDAYVGGKKEVVEDKKEGKSDKKSIDEKINILESKLKEVQPYQDVPVSIYNEWKDQLNDLKKQRDKNSPQTRKRVSKQ